MIKVDNVLISDDIKEKFFVCDLEQCKGACCVEGELGAPLDDIECSVLEIIFHKVESYLSKEGIEAISKQGLYVFDEDGEYSTPTIGGKECAYAIYDEHGVLKCGIEQAFLDGKTQFRKPISCHLYPIRVSKFDEFDALNYDDWYICSAACSLGNKLGVPVYQFLKDALIRKYGLEWYKKLTESIEEGAYD